MSNRFFLKFLVSLVFYISFINRTFLGNDSEKEKRCPVLFEGDMPVEPDGSLYGKRVPYDAMEFNEYCRWLFDNKVFKNCGKNCKNDVKNWTEKEINLFFCFVFDFNAISKRACIMSRDEKEKSVRFLCSMVKENPLEFGWERVSMYARDYYLLKKIKMALYLCAGGFTLFQFLMPIYKSVISKWIKKVMFKFGIGPVSKNNKKLIKNINELFFGYKDLKKKINGITRNLLKMKKSKELQFINGAIFYGDPGCGKTYMVELISQYTGLPLFSFSLSAIINESGSIENNIKLIFEKVQGYAEYHNTPVILFIDEIDMILPSRNMQSTLNQDEKIALQDFLNILCNTKGIFVVGNTNYLEKIDSSILRDGRLGIHINFHLPTLIDIKEILEHLFEQKKINFIDSFEIFAEKLEGKNVASIKIFLDNYLEYIKEKKLVACMSSLDQYIDKYGV